ncbi:Nuclear transport factor 2 [Coemansia sp. RSA 988]|nr:Nuclear transport factor 2 [Coemansia sp. RSA 988]
MSDITAIANQFINYYYQTFDSDRKGLAALYRDVSMLTWEKTQHHGTANIIKKLEELPFRKIAHKVTTIDTQPSLPGSNAIVIAVTGQVLIDEETRPQQFMQVFQLVEDNGFFIFNDIFNLNYA